MNLQINYKNKFRTCLQRASLVEAGWAFFTILFCGLKDIRSRSFKWSFKGFSFWSFLKEFEVSRSYFWPPKRRCLGWWSALWLFVACNLDLLFLVCNHVERRPCWRSIHRIFFSKNLHKNRVQFPYDVTCKPAIERFHSSRGQRLCKFTGTEEIFYITKSFYSHWIGFWKTNMANVSLFWDNMADVTLCENAL